MGRRFPEPRWVVVLTVLGLAGVVLWLVRGGNGELERLKAELQAQGEKLTVEELSLAPVQTNEAVWTILEAAEPVFEAMSRAEVAGVTYDGERCEPPHVAWRQPVLHTCVHRVLDWDKAAAVIDETSGELAPLHEAMKDPPSGGWEATQVISGTPFNFAPLRLVVQGLHERTMVELHRGQLDVAFTNLLTLIRSIRYHEDDRTLVGQMIRVAIAGLVADAVWQAMQAEGWSESPLRALQEELQSVHLLEHMAEAMEFERVSMMLEMDRIREGGLDYVEDLSQRYGLASVSGWKHRIQYFHWRRFRAARAEISTMRDLQVGIDAYRDLRAGRPFNELTWRQPVARTKPRLDRWLDAWVNPGGRWTILGSYSNGPNFTRAPEHAVGNDTRRRLAIAAIALERHRLARGEVPEALETLVPEYLPSVPADPYDGRPIRFERFSSGQFILYAVGTDGVEEFLGREDPWWPAAESSKPDAATTESLDPADQEEVLSLVYFQNAPLLDVIKTLARQASMNIVFEHGIPETAFPPVNIRFENVTAKAVLEALLKNYGLKLRLSPRSRISLITR